MHQCFAVKVDAYSYALSRPVYCAHCFNQPDGNPIRTYLTGKTGNKKESRRYRHHTERRCGAQNRSVNADLIEADVYHILECLTVRQDALSMLIEALEQFHLFNRDEEYVNTVQAEIAHWQQRIKNANVRSRMFESARKNGEKQWRVLNMRLGGCNLELQRKMKKK